MDAAAVEHSGLTEHGPGADMKISDSRFTAAMHSYFGDATRGTTLGRRGNP